MTPLKDHHQSIWSLLEKENNVECLHWKGIRKFCCGTDSIESIDKFMSIDDCGIKPFNLVMYFNLLCLNNNKKKENIFIFSAFTAEFKKNISAL